MGEQRWRVIMAGPRPPAIGGMASVVDDLFTSSLHTTTTIELFDTGKQTTENRRLVDAVLARLRMWGQWWRSLGERPVPIAHIHTCSGLSYFLDGALLLLARLRGAPVILHIHGGRFDAFLDGLGPFGSAVARLIARRASRIIVLSQGWREQLEPRLPGAHLCVIENAVPLRAVDPVIRKRQPPLILFLGALCKDKGVEELVRAFAHLKREAELAIVGPETEASFVARIRVIAAELGIEGRLHIPGPTRGDEKNAWLAKAAIFALPSYVEGQPISVLEAMAAALPVIATTVGALPSMIESGRTGLLVEPGDVDALARAMDLLLGDAALRVEMGERGLRHCERRYGIERAVKELRALYADVGAAAQVEAAR